ncbi:hypothetical protein FLAG1_11002 [Fusarium langsethiae]|uniref:Uncharacterized protein n=1 Tax=Fusarium langsethiae TaxID=179993 RepID=A0A0N0DB50_FUSLA|nr:hypothetical protein FLAG1_11002 [Fusarium langsethiae]GKU09305.1 unnamed protein product [Fusarium langsethiae]
MEEEVCNALPAGEAKSIWLDAERKFWEDFRGNEEMKKGKIRKESQHSRSKVQLKLSGLGEQRSQLMEEERRLNNDLAKVKAEFARITDEHGEEAERLKDIEQKYQESCKILMEHRHRMEDRMTRFFREKRGEDPDTHDTREPESEGLVLPHALPELSSASNRPVPHRELINASTTEETNGENHDGLLKGIKHHDHEPTQTLVSVVDVDGTMIGRMEHIESASRKRAQRKRDREDGADETALPRRQLDPRHGCDSVSTRSCRTSLPASTWQEQFRASTVTQN